MEVKLYVGNLSYTTTEADLLTLFAKAGRVASVALVKDRDTGNSKGFAFVSMASQVEAQKAISKFDGLSFNNREMKVNLARPRAERSGGPSLRDWAKPSSGGPSLRDWAKPSSGGPSLRDWAEHSGGPSLPDWIKRS